MFSQFLSIADVATLKAFFHLSQLASSQRELSFNHKARNFIFDEMQGLAARFGMTMISFSWSTRRSFGSELAERAG